MLLRSPHILTRWSTRSDFYPPDHHICQWRTSYVRVCQYQRRISRVMSLPFLICEATFLSQLMIDINLIHLLPDRVPFCFRLRKIPRTASQFAKVAGSLATAFGLPLAGIKLEDDLIDSSRQFNRLAFWIYRRPITKAARLLATNTRDLPERIATVVNQHRQLED